MELPDEQKVENDKSYIMRILRRASMVLFLLQDIIKGFIYFSKFKLSMAYYFKIIISLYLYSLLRVISLVQEQVHLVTRSSRLTIRCGQIEIYEKDVYLVYFPNLQLTIKLIQTT